MPAVSGRSLKGVCKATNCAPHVSLPTGHSIPPKLLRAYYSGFANAQLHLELPRQSRTDESTHRFNASPDRATCPLLPVVLKKRQASVCVCVSHLMLVDSSWDNGCQIVQDSRVQRSRDLLSHHGAF